MGSENRKKTENIQVRLTPEEKGQIEELANKSGMKPTTFMRGKALGHRVSSSFDKKAIQEIITTRTILAKTGGLLKMWLTNDEDRSVHNLLEVGELVQKINSEIFDIRQSLITMIQTMNGSKQ